MYSKKKNEEEYWVAYRIINQNSSGKRSVFSRIAVV
jgi:hypothetical protein